MVYSMTGFGSSKFENDNYQIQVEVKSLNSKYFDLQLRMPRTLSDKEMEIRSLASRALVRGKIIISIDLEINSSDSSFLNSNKFKSYYKEISDLADEMGYGGDDLFRLTLAQPDIANTSSLGSTSDELFNLVTEQLNTAFNQCLEFRKNEGQNLEIELKGYVEAIAQAREKIIGLEKARTERVRSKLEDGLANFAKAEDIDSNRLEQELIYYIEKLDITEELVRLNSHIEYFSEVLKEKNCGKKLGFLSQELGREINTIGSKANDAEIQQIVVLMKEELEKIKEQSLNVL